jgi:hypothetical protein
VIVFAYENGGGMKTKVSLRKYFAPALLLTGVIALFSGNIFQPYFEKIFFRHPTSASGITIGMTKADVVFKLGAGTPLKKKGLRYHNGLTIRFNQEDRAYVIVGNFRQFLPFDNPIKKTEDLKDIFGEPQIYSSSDDFKTRRYTYSDDNLISGVTYSYETNALKEVMIGEITTRGSHGGNSEYIVNGIKLCPGAKCPFEQNGELKTKFSGKKIHQIMMYNKGS